MLDPVNVGIEESNTLYVPQTFLLYPAKHRCSVWPKCGFRRCMSAFLSFPGSRGTEIDI